MQKSQQPGSCTNLWCLTHTDIKKTRKIKTVVEEVVDGKVVSSEIKEVEESV